MSSNEDERIRIITQRRFVRSISNEGIGHQALDLSFIGSDYLIIPNVFDKDGLIQVVKLFVPQKGDNHEVINAEEGIRICAFIQCGGGGYESNITLFLMFIQLYLTNFQLFLYISFLVQLILPSSTSDSRYSSSTCSSPCCCTQTVPY